MGRTRRLLNEPNIIAPNVYLAVAPRAVRHWTTPALLAINILSYRGQDCTARPVLEKATDDPLRILQQVLDNCRAARHPPVKWAMPDPAPSLVDNPVTFRVMFCRRQSVNETDIVGRYLDFANLP